MTEDDGSHMAEEPLAGGIVMRGSWGDVTAQQRRRFDIVPRSKTVQEMAAAGAIFAMSGPSPLYSPRAPAACSRVSSQAIVKE